jgi:hypothetical protein
MRNGILRFAFLAMVAGVFVAAVAEAAGPFQFYSVTPCRILDTRFPAPAQPILNGGGDVIAVPLRNFLITGGACGLPATAKAATLNITMVGPTRGGYLTIWPFGGPKPLVSTLNANAGEPAIANGAIVPLADPTTGFSISIYYGTNIAPGGASTNAIVDVTGYFQ